MPNDRRTSSDTYSILPDIQPILASFLLGLTAGFIVMAVLYRVIYGPFA